MKTAAWLPALPLLLALACSRDDAPARSSGVIVESLSPMGAAARAGLRPGDVLLSWRQREPHSAAGALSSCADLAAVEIEQAPRGPVEVRRLRGGQESSLELPAGDWEVEALPRNAGTKDPCRAQARARRRARAQKWREAAAAWEEALRGTDGGHAARILREQGICFTTLDDFPSAERSLNESLQRLRRAAPGSLDEAASWNALGRMEQRRGAYERSTELLRHALALRSRLAPRSLERATTLNNLGINAWYQGDLGRARALYTAALALIRQRAPGGPDEARLLNNLGLLARASGDATGAEGHFTSAARIWKRLDPKSTDLARTYANLGALAADRGEISLSEDYYRTALRRLEAVSPGSLEIARLYKNLGMNARDRHDLPEAETLLRRALAIERAQAPGTALEGTSLNVLSWIVEQQGRPREAEELARQALAIRSRAVPGSLDVAISLANLGAFAGRRGDLKTAASLGEQALALQRKASPGTMHESHILAMLSGVALEQKRWSEATRRAREGLEVARRLAPQSWYEARLLNYLAVALWKSGHPEEARPVFAAAASVLENQTGRIGGTDAGLSAFRESFSGVYQNLATLDIQAGRPGAALETLERWRARVLLAQLAEHALVLSPDVPHTLLVRQRRLDREYERTQGLLARADPQDGGAIQELLVRLSQLRNERAAVTAAIVRSSPHYASLRYPQPLNLAAARRALDPGTVWLSYLLGSDGLFLFVVTPAQDPRVFRLPVSEKALAEETAVFRGLILRGKDSPGVEKALLVQGRKLYGLLIAPAAPWIERADRILISPDGPLHILPFAALVRTEKPRPGEPARFLVEWKPVHTVLSATLYAELKRGRRGGPSGGGPLVAFADPRLPSPASSAGSEDDPPLRRYRAGLPPLPGVRDEVRALSTLYGRDAVIYTGAQATEAQVFQPGTRPRILHFASHALLDRRSPLDSGLALAPAGKDGDGLLQAWEILERLRVDADLVTLSACDTGLGREAGGEGLIGLTRAFQYAGARSVLASLWGAPDRSTAVLMARFYARLRAGMPKDVALAEAQRQLLRTRELAQPYSWAGFELNGDWR